MSKSKVLFLCTGNSARSQMAEAWLRHLAGHRFEAFSAGLEPAGMNPLTVQVMKEVGIDVSSQGSKHLDRYLGKEHFAYVITVCSKADSRCPAVFAGMGKRLHWPFDDPAAVPGSQPERLAAFRRVRDRIKQRIETWLSDQADDESP